MKLCGPFRFLGALSSLGHIVFMGEDGAAVTADPPLKGSVQSQRSHIGCGLPTFMHGTARGSDPDGEGGGSMPRWSAPEVLETMRRQLGVAHRVLDVLVPEIGLQGAGVVAGVGQGVAAAVPQSPE
jgi:hypothetical protein